MNQLMTKINRLKSVKIQLRLILDIIYNDRYIFTEMKESKRIYTSSRNQKKNTTTISLTLNVNRETNQQTDKKKHR